MADHERPSKLRKLNHEEQSLDVTTTESGGVHTHDATNESTMSAENSSLETTHKSLGSENVSSTSKPSTVKVENGDTADMTANGVGGSKVPQNATPTTTEKPMSKNQLKKLRRDQKWEAGRETRKIQRKEKMKEKKEKKRALRGQQQPNDENATPTEPKKKHHLRPKLLPITLLLDCQFNDLMNHSELISLGAQVTRCYSENNRAPYKAHLVVSSWGGVLKERFDTILAAQYQNWKGTKFLSEPFLQAAEKAKEAMKGPHGGILAGAFASYNDNTIADAGSPSTSNETSEETAPSKPITESTMPTAQPSLPPIGTPGEIIYLTSDSPNTLSHLSPHSVYIIGGIVDKNRHKGLCYKIARDAGADMPPKALPDAGGSSSNHSPSNFQTAKLPIEKYLSMRSRTVLTTNHVYEIMLKWLECGDWGEAFEKVMPKRKGAVLRKEKGGEKQGSEGEGEEDGDGSVVGEVVDEEEVVGEGENGDDGVGEDENENGELEQREQDDDDDDDVHGEDVEQICRG